MRNCLTILFMISLGVFAGCGTPEEDRLQFVGTWSFDLSHNFTPPASVTKLEEAGIALAKLMLTGSTLELQQDGKATLNVGGLMKTEKGLEEHIRTGTWEVSGSGAGLKLKLSFPVIQPAAAAAEANAKFDVGDYSLTLISASIPQGEGSWNPITMGTPNKFGTVDKFSELLPSSTREYSRLK